jgi:hypothetical protein
LHRRAYDLLIGYGKETVVAEAKVIRIKRELGEGNWFYATSPDLVGLLVAQETLDGLDKAIPQAIVDLYAARKIDVYVYPVDDGNEGPHGAWVAVPMELLKAHTWKPSPALV